ncbi:MAG: aldose 1-epimerase family protein [Gaiellaceae bacterium]
MTPATDVQVEIAAADQLVGVDLVGGGLRSYSVGGRELLDGYSPGEASTSGRGQVLIPWPNRLEGGTYEFDGLRHQLPLTEPERGNAIHGLVREERWTIGEHEPHRVVLEHVLRPQAGYPFTLSLGIAYSLSGSGLRVDTTATNTGSEACPYGCGQHPYLTLGAADVDLLVLCAPGGTVLIEDERGIPCAREPVGGTEFDFRRPREIGATKLDDAFTHLERGTDGLARVELRDPKSRAGLSLWVDERYRYLQLFTGDRLPDVQRRSIAVEPMTCPPNALRTGEDLIRLEPGESVTSAWGIVP